jgi:hypothetical protein
MRPIRCVSGGRDRSVAPESKSVWSSERPGARAQLRVHRRSTRDDTGALKCTLPPAPAAGLHLPSANLADLADQRSARVDAGQLSWTYVDDLYQFYVQTPAVPEPILPLLLVTLLTSRRRRA